MLNQATADLLGCRAETKAARLAEENQRLRLASADLTASTAQPEYEMPPKTGILYAVLLLCTDHTYHSNLARLADISVPSRSSCTAHTANNSDTCVITRSWKNLQLCTHFVLL